MTVKAKSSTKKTTKKTTPKSRKATTKKETTKAVNVEVKKEEKVLDKDTIAKEKVSQILEDVQPLINEAKSVTNPETTEKKEVVENQADLLDQAVTENNSEWLKEQFQKLTEQNKILSDDNVRLKDDYKKLLQQIQSGKSPVNVDDSELKSSVTKLFLEFYGNLLGKNPQKTPYKDVKLEHVVKKFILFFPFLQQK